jgi:hypothetical protein
MRLILYSDPAELGDFNDVDNEIHIFSQFYVSPNPIRHREILASLRANIENRAIHQIHLLNETMYQIPEMNDEKVVQTNINKRLTYDDVFEYVRNNSIKGYIVMINMDIFFDDNLYMLQYSALHRKKQMFAQLRYEYNRNIESSPIFGPRSDSQDTWILHSNYMIQSNHDKAFHFPFGIPGCDNKIIYLFKVLGYTIINDPIFIKSYHNHASNVRLNYEPLPLPYGYIVPYAYPTMNPALGVDIATICAKANNVSFDDNDKLRDYITKKLIEETPFIIPRIAGVENNVALAINAMRPSNCESVQKFCAMQLRHMKYNAGIHFSEFPSLINYSNLYLDAFQNSELFCCWDFQGEYIKHIAQSHGEVLNMFPNRTHVWAFTLDIFHYIYSNPWTSALKGKRILIVSAFISSMQEQLPYLSKIYDNVDIFPECTFRFIKPPMKQAEETSEDFYSELLSFYAKLDEEKDNYDIALVSSGGNGNIICNYIFTNHGKSAIYVGGVLQMYFGILGNRWVRERPDILKLFHNSYWTRPKESERPNGFYHVEESCYW